MECLVFTPAALLDLLSKIDELKDSDIGISQTLDGELQLQVGESYYLISDDNASEVSVSEDVVDQVEDANIEAYSELEGSDGIEVNISDDEVVESGVLKEIAKTLLLGGMIRLTGKMLTK